MLFKAGVSLRGLVPQMLIAMNQIERLFDKITNSEMVVTSCNDNKHMEGSKHYTGEAVDIRTHGVELSQMRKIIEMAKWRLDAHFDLVFEAVGTENEHLHVEFQEH